MCRESAGAGIYRSAAWILCAGKSRWPWLPFPWKDQQLRDHHPAAAATGKERLRVHELVIYLPERKMTLSYLRDLSNSMGLSMLYFLSYFLSSYFPFKFEEWIEVGISHEDFESLMKQKRKTVLRKKIENIFS